MNENVVEYNQFTLQMAFSQREISGEKMAKEEIDFNGKKYELTFYDDFNGTELDKSKFDHCPEWERQTHMKRHGWWRDECSYVRDGNLVIECKKGSDGKLISGGVRTKTQDFSKVMFEQAQGLYEIKFKCDEADGLWWAFWSEGITGEDGPFDGTAQDGAEVDFFEILPGPSEWVDENGNTVTKRGRLKSTVIWDGYGEHKGLKEVPGVTVTQLDPDFYSKWHVFQFLWDNDGYSCYLDGKLLWVMDGQTFGNGIDNTPGYIKITGEFGEWDGETDKAILNGESRFMYVDYVKVYTQK